jgi:mono/diheme cytochrome c family protein
LKSKVAVIFIFLILTDCVQEMAKTGHIQPHQQMDSDLNVTGLPPDGTVAQNIVPLKVFSAGFNLPRPFRKDLVMKGKEQFEINCLPCHGVSGFGDGMVVKRGFLAPPSFHIDRLRQVSDQHIYDVITNGYGAMYSYRVRVTAASRWAVVSYIRALQLSQNIAFSKLSTADKLRLNARSP